MAKKNIDLSVLLNDASDYKDWLVELKERFYSHRLKASCATKCQQPIDDFKMLFSIPWDHHRRIIDKCNDDMDKALFFVRKTW